MEGGGSEEDTLRIDARHRIPLAEIRFEAVRASGPGGQNVNKTATKVTAVFHPDRCARLDDVARRKIQERLAARLTLGGALRVTSDRTRSQARNRADALEKLRELLRDALRPRRHRRPTRPTRSSREKRLRRKRERGQRKRARGWRPEES